MKNAIICAACLMTGSGAFAKSNDMMNVLVKTGRIILASVHPDNFVAGDTANYDLTVSSFSGTLVMTVKSVDSTGVWLDENASILGQTEDVQELIDPSTGQILQEIVNGQQQTPPPADDVQIISTSLATITVPAGTFNTQDIKAHLQSENQDEEMWIDSDDVLVGGMVKMTTTQQGMAVEADLTSQTHGTGSKR
jgi:hypothetical protein